MIIKTLDGLSTAEVANAFNAAFIDYKIPMNLSSDAMATKMKAENIRLRDSIGTFDGEELVGFILTGRDLIHGKQVAYNAGTGVFPQQRGNGLAKKMYRFLIDHLLKQDCYDHVLEVFDDNAKAIATYKQAGFEVKRTLNCYKGTLPLNEPTKQVQEIEINEELFRSFWDVRPSWQNDLPAVNRNREEHKVIGIVEDGTLVAYAIFTPHNGRLKQIAVKHEYRRQGYANALLNSLNVQCSGIPVLATGVQDNEAVTSFFVKHNMQPFLKMFEMEMQVQTGNHLSKPALAEHH